MSPVLMVLKTEVVHQGTKVEKHCSTAHHSCFGLLQEKESFISLMTRSNLGKSGEALPDKWSGKGEHIKFMGDLVVGSKVWQALNSAGRVDFTHLHCVACVQLEVFQYKKRGLQVITKSHSAYPFYCLFSHFFVWCNMPSLKHTHFYFLTRARMDNPSSFSEWHVAYFDIWKRTTEP